MACCYQSATSLEETSTSGTIEDGLIEYSIANIGEADGTVDGATFPAGTTVTYRAGPKLLKGIDYDATGTIFLISRIRAGNGS